MARYRVACAAIVIAAVGASGVAEARWWKAYFTSGAVCRWSDGVPEQGLVSAIENARSYVRAAWYDVSSPRVVRALIAAKRRGVAVECVTESRTGHKSRAALGMLTAAGIPVVKDGGRGLMHNKFAVIDGVRVWTGSYNPTENDSYKNDNNALLIESHELSEIFEAEFEEMFHGRIFGNRREPGPFAIFRTRHHVRIEGTDVNVYFSPEDDVERIIVKRLAKAKKSIVFMAFSFTSDPIGEMMIRKHREGVRVRGVFEKKGSGQPHSEYDKLKNEGIPVKLDRSRGLMHHKVMIIDEVRVITGSYNFSRNARRRNDENIVVIDNAEIAAVYLKEFERVYQ